MAISANVISHWDQLIENFQASSVEFYNLVERAVVARSVPEAHWTRVEHQESGLASAKRQYLRMHRGKHAFDICAAPFGTGFFVSWWLTEPPLPFGILYTLAFLFCLMIGFYMAFAIGFGIGALMQGYAFGVLLGGSCAFFGLPGLLWVLGNAMRQGKIQGESTVLAMPLIGHVYERIFAPTTYYSIDTGLMFQQSVHNAVLEVIDCMTANKGVRALTETERKPILKKFAASA
ncbi:MAG TPA: hypothetical protein VNH83_13405 [Bryobacteraceae bacterium]|nr:hypothetical protein [Bryobacteraceae bacterium]